MSVDFFKDKYRVQSARLPGWDYSSRAWYFITICTRKHENYFGDILNGILILSELGNVIKSEWQKTPQIRSDMNIELGEFIVMPNHFHALIYIGDNEFNSKGKYDFNLFAPQSNNLASIIRGFKSVVTKYARINKILFDWQPRFYDHIVHNETEFNKIQKYIRENPLKWENDKFYKS